MVKANEYGVKRVNIVCEDTFVFVLLLHFYLKSSMSCTLTMEGPSFDWTSLILGQMERQHMLVQPPAPYAL